MSPALKLEPIQDWSSVLGASLTQLTQALLAYLPNLIGAALVLLAGWLLARLLRLLIVRFGAALDRLYGLARQRAGLALAPSLRWPLSRLAGNLGYWAVLVVALVVAAQVLGLPGIADGLARAIGYLPGLIAAMAIVLAGYLVGGWARESVTGAALGAGLDNAAPLGRLAQAGILVFAVILAVGHAGLDVALLINVVSIAVAAILGGAALAFGLGAGPAVANILASHYVQRLYRVGQRVRVGDIEGDILELTPTAVILDTADGRALIPAKAFTDGASTLVDEGDHDA